MHLHQYSICDWVDSLIAPSGLVAISSLPPTYSPSLSMNYLTMVINQGCSHSLTQGIIIRGDLNQGGPIARLSLKGNQDNLSV
jgi:hypothetical protein